MNPSFFYLKRKNIALEPELQAYLDRITLEGFTPLPMTQVAAMNKLIFACKANGSLWSKAKVFRVKSTGDLTTIDATKINIKNASGDLATYNGGFIYTLDGIKTNAVNSYTNEKFNPTTLGLSVNNFGVIHQFQNDFTLSNNALCGMGRNAPDRRLGLFPRGTGNVSFIYSNDFTGDISLLPTTNRIHAIGRNATKKTSQVNGNYSEFTTPVVGALLDYDYYTGAYNNKGVPAFFCNGTDSLFIAGEWFTEMEVNQLIIDLNGYYTEIGRPTIPT